MQITAEEGGAQRLAEFDQRLIRGVLQIHAGETTQDVRRGCGAEPERRRVLDHLVVLVTELSRWGRSTLDLLHTLKALEAQRVSVDLTTPHGRMMATIIAGIADFERELIQERIRSGIAAAKARGKRLGRQPGQRPKSDRLASKVMALVAIGRSYRLIGREVGLSKNTVADIVKRHRTKTAQIA